MDIIRKIFHLFNNDSQAPNIDILRREFQSLFDCFKQLITTNREALETMTEITEALHEGLPVGMTFVRSRCKRISKNVYRIIQLLNTISPEKYKQLFEKYQQIESNIGPLSGSNMLPDSENFILPLKSIDLNYTEQVGEKMSSLGEIYNALHLQVPSGFVITASAYWHFMELTGLQLDIDKLLSTLAPGNMEKLHQVSATIQNLIHKSILPSELDESISFQVRRLYEEIGNPVPLAVRSSAQGEGLPGNSCAGMYHTYLGVMGDEIITSYKKVISSKYEERAILFRLNHGINDKDMAMCVGCIPLINARCGGVVYSRDPLKANDNHIQIHSAFGLPNSVVDGRVESDIITVSRSIPPQIVRKEIAKKENFNAYHKDRGLVTLDLPSEQKTRQSIDDSTALELCRQVLQIEKHFATSQDIEWAVDDEGSIVILQSRALVLHVNNDEVMEGGHPAEVLATGHVTASPGIAAGPVYSIYTKSEIFKLPEKSIIVFKLPIPNWAIAVKRAAAIICEQGGIAGHLANVAREMHVPALFGVRDAMRRFQPGEVITVDADRKKIFRGKIDQLKGKRKEKHNFIKSEGYTILEKASKHITPLYLLDPGDQTQFTAEYCSTYHDITRFCHEKAIDAMFNFGLKRNFPERSAKRLFVNGPTQFWIIDLADGFAKDKVKGKYVKLNEIVSLPMQALWHGMVTIPWNIPRVDTRGFLEVLMESTMNTGLNYSASSPYTKKNYFMITRKYCSAHIHFGFHFSTIEALVGNRRYENYVSFNFTGGGAEMERRNRRARLVADILEEYNFRVNIVGDSLRARIEKYDLDFTKMRLEVAGYLMFHTRQLDMVLKNKKMVNLYKEKMCNDLKKLLIQYEKK